MIVNILPQGEGKMFAKVRCPFIICLYLSSLVALTACAGAAPAPANPSAAENGGQAEAPATEAPAVEGGGQAESPATEAPAAAAEPASGGQVVLIIPEEPALLNYYLADAAIVRQVADATSMTGLTTVDENGEYQPVLAAEVPLESNGGLSSDLKTVTWKLRPGLKWSDGQPLTSDDVKFTWEALSHPDSGALQTQGVDLIESIETPDELTAIVKYKEPYVGYQGQFAFGLFPRHATGKPEEMTTWEWNRQPVGAGPFVVTNWQAGDSITMERNPNYFEEGKPYLDRLVFKIIPESAAQTALMVQQEAQVHLWPGEDAANYDALLAGKARQVLVPGIWNMAIDFNLSRPFDDDPTADAPHPILGDERVRQAIAHAIDYETLTKDVMRDVVATSTNPFEYGWYECDIPRAYPYDPEAAKKLLEEAGWLMGDDGIRVAKGAKYAEDGTRLSLELQGYTNFEPLERTEQFIVEKLKEVGIEARIQNYDFSIIFGSFADGSPRKTGDFDMLIYDRGFTIEPQGEVSRNWSSTAIPSADNPDGDNNFRWVEPKADEAIAAAGSTFDLAARKAAYCQLGEMIAKDLPQIYLYLFQDGYGISDKLTGYNVSTWGSMTWGVQNWSLKQ
jgi:peptide/nickel transport system substrate-binding protein